MDQTPASQPILRPFLIVTPASWHFCSNPAERECEALDDEIARLESAVKALHQQSVTKLIRDNVM